ncbi:MAG: phosphatidylglycerophosphatase A [Desulfocapsaceae bacterium]|nr:phosphatidylglycerophosphatase A [Desulfocapsaceae bacterium]
MFKTAYCKIQLLKFVAARLTENIAANQIKVWFLTNSCEIENPSMDQFFIIIATGLYSGMLPLAPGIWGSTLAMFLCYYCKKLPLLVYFGITAGLFFIGTIAAEMTEKMLAEVDASPIVIDEILGIFIAFAFIPFNKAVWLVGLLIFVVLDGLKPFPASWVELNVEGGLGIMLDDVVAGVYALILLRVFSYLLSKIKDR